MKNKRLVPAAIISAVLLLTGISLTQTAWADSPNLIPNASVETPNPSNNNQPLNWTTDHWGTNKATFSYLTTGYTGSKSVKVQITKSGSGDAKWYFQEVPVVPGNTYLFSDYSISNVKSRVTIQYHLKSGSFRYVDLGTPAASANWQQFQKSFTVPANVVSLTVFHLITASGYLTVDDYSLTLVTKDVIPPSVAITQPTQGSTISGSATLSAVASDNILVQNVQFSIDGAPFGSPLTVLPYTVSWNTTSASNGTHTITAQATDSSGNTASSSIQVIVANIISPPPPPPPSPVNIIPNSSVETGSSDASLPANWNKEKWGTNTTAFSYVKNQGHSGNNSVKVQITKYTSGDAKWYFDSLPVTPGDTYQFSDWYQSNITSRVVVWFANTDGTDYYLELRNAPPSSDWTQYSESFQVPISAKTFTVFHLISAVGWLATDDYFLAKFTPNGFNRPIVTLAFDDGWENNTLTVLPILKNYGYNATYFFATTYLENSPPTGAINVSGPAAVKAIFDDGHEIGSHSVTHPDLTTVSSSQLAYELSHSKEYLESIIGVGEVKNFASPYGTYNETVINAIKGMYRSHRPTDEGFNSRENFDPYRLKVQNMKPTTSLAQFQSWINQTVKDKTWMILIYHRVASADLGDYDTSLQDFQPQLDIIKNSGIAVKTIDQALNELTSQISP